MAPGTTISHMRRDVPFHAGKPIETDPGVSARAGLAQRAGEKIGRSSGRDMSDVSDTEALDLIEYMLLPNTVSCGGPSVPICSRFRPLGDNPERSIMEIMFLFSKAPTEAIRPRRRAPG